MPPPTGNEIPRILLSASRRTDIPAFFMNWFMAGIERGCFDVENPFNRRISRVPADLDRVHAIVFWSKNYARFMKDGYGQQLQRLGYHLLFHFTINSDSLVLEPNIPPLARRLEQMEILARRYPAGAIVWRFDPICCYRLGDGKIRNNLADFERIADAAAECEIRRCVSSFADYYRKVRKRVAKADGFQWIEPDRTERLAILKRMGKILGERGISVPTASNLAATTACTVTPIQLAGCQAAADECFRWQTQHRIDGIVPTPDPNVVDICSRAGCAEHSLTTWGGAGPSGSSRWSQPDLVS